MDCVVNLVTFAEDERHQDNMPVAIFLDIPSDATANVLAVFIPASLLPPSILFRSLPFFIFVVFLFFLFFQVAPDTLLHWKPSHSTRKHIHGVISSISRGCTNRAITSNEPLDSFCETSSKVPKHPMCHNIQRVVSSISPLHSRNNYILSYVNTANEQSHPPNARGSRGAIPSPAYFLTLIIARLAP